MIGSLTVRSITVRMVLAGLFLVAIAAIVPEPQLDLRFWTALREARMSDHSYIKVAWVVYFEIRILHGIYT